MSEWHWPQLALAVLMVLEAVTHVSNHGKPRTPYDGPSRTIGVAITAVILWAGGFWG